MGALNIIIGVFVVIITLTILIQPVNILNENAQNSLENSGSTVKYGTNSAGEVIEVGASSALSGITTALLYFIGLAILGGFIVWVIRYGRGGYYDEGDIYQ